MYRSPIAHGGKSLHHDIPNPHWALHIPQGAEELLPCHTGRPSLHGIRMQKAPAMPRNTGCWIFVHRSWYALSQVNHRWIGSLAEPRRRARLPPRNKSGKSCGKVRWRLAGCNSACTTDPATSPYYARPQQLRTERAVVSNLMALERAFCHIPRSEVSLRRLLAAKCRGPVMQGEPTCGVPNQRTLGTKFCPRMLFPAMLCLAGSLLRPRHDNICDLPGDQEPGL